MLLINLLYNDLFFFFHLWGHHLGLYIASMLLSGELFVFLAATFTWFCVLLEALVWSNFTFFLVRTVSFIMVIMLTAICYLLLMSRTLVLLLLGSPSL